MTENLSDDNKTLIEFWNKAFALSDEDKERESKNSTMDIKELAPSLKLYEAAKMLGGQRKVLDYGCGSGWASIIAARNGCNDVTAVDPAEGAISSARFYLKLFEVEEKVQTKCISSNWLEEVEDGSFDGFISSNVLDVVPFETTKEILQEVHRILSDDAKVVIGLNYYFSEEAAAKKGLELIDGNRLYVDGVLRLVSFSDEEWIKIFSPWFEVEKLDHFAWPSETMETRRLFFLRKR